MKRILDCQASDFSKMSRRELLDAIAGSEGRTIACETIGAMMPNWVATVLMYVLYLVIHAVPYLPSFFANRRKVSADQ